MSYTPESDRPPHPTGPEDSARQDVPDEEAGRGASNRPSNGRIAIWVAVSAVGLYFLGSGIYGIVTGGH